MIQYNLDIMNEIRHARVKQYEIANELGMAPSNFCSMLRTRELSESTKGMIRTAIKDILKGDDA